MKAPTTKNTRSRGTAGSGTRTLLYIEDNRANIRLMEEIVALVTGMTIISARNVKAGLQLAEARHPDIVICDINLPDADGYEALQRLCTMEATRKTPVLALSANALPKDVEKAAKAGFDAYLIKPINVEQTVATIRNAVGDVPGNVIDFEERRSNGA